MSNEFLSKVLTILYIHFTQELFINFEKKTCDTFFFIFLQESFETLSCIISGLIILLSKFIYLMIINLSVAICLYLYFKVKNATKLEREKAKESGLMKSCNKCKQFGEKRCTGRSVFILNFKMVCSTSKSLVRS